MGYIASMLERNTSLKSLDISRNALGFHSVHRLQVCLPFVCVCVGGGSSFGRILGVTVTLSVICASVLDEQHV